MQAEIAIDTDLRIDAFEMIILDYARNRISEVKQGRRSMAADCQGSDGRTADAPGATRVSIRAGV